MKHDSLYGPINSDWRSAAGKFEWQISIPPNTTALVYVPVKTGGVVTEGGKAAGDQRGIKFRSLENGRAIYEVGSGAYDFESPL